MKCQFCGSEEFIGHQMVRMDVVCDGSGNYEDAVNRVDPMQDIYDSGVCYGPFQCRRCGAEYEELKDGQEPNSGPVYGWVSSAPFRKVLDQIGNLGQRKQKWEGERYNVLINFFDVGPLIRVTKRENVPAYLPAIGCYVDDEGELLGVVVETRSFGTLSLGEFGKFADAVKMAQVDAGDIERFFIQPLKAKAFEMGELIN